MRDSRIRLTLLVALVLAAAAVSSRLWADPPKSIWPTYHADMLRQGINRRATDIANPASLNLIWVFPRATEEAVQEEYKFIVDNRDPLFSLGGDWRAGYDPEAWGYSTAGGAAEASPYSYLWAPADNPRYAADPDVKGPRARAVWHFPTAIPKGYYQVWVWVPPGPPVVLSDLDSPAYRFTTAAQYTVYHGQGSVSVNFDQSQGGTWQLLSVDPYPFTGSGDMRVELTNLTSDLPADISAKDIRVAADAIKFTPVTGQQIYSSPTSAEIDFNWISSSDPTLKWSGRIPVVYTGTVEQPLTLSSRSQDSGAIYCINSITPDVSAQEGLNGLSNLHTELSKLLGTPLWRYPRDFESMSAQNVKDFLTEPNSSLEGPIQGGVYSSITLAHVPPLLSVGDDQFICVATAMDRQMYGLDARTGKLLWKGPGVTLSENSIWTTEPDLTSNKLRNDAFGGQYQWVQLSTGPGDMTWDFSNKVSKTGALGGSRSYSVYAWIPVAKGDELPRITDAQYTITYDGGKTGAAPPVNQKLVANQGSWVKLGTWFGVQSVSLSTKKGANDPADSCVVADAVMIVPDTIGAFSYCTAATDVALDADKIYQQDPGFRATAAFASTALAGRLVCFDLQQSLSNAANGDAVGYVKWIYPTIRSTNVITDPNTNKGGDQPDMGSVGASPTFYEGQNKKMVYLPTLGGTIHCVDADTGDLLGTFKDPGAGTGTGGDGPALPDLTGSAGFTSSVSIGQTDSGDKCLFIGSVDGSFYALNPEPDAKKNLVRRTKYQPGVPYGAFRFSTPSTVVKSNIGARVWAPSTDGHIYALTADDPASAAFLTRMKPSVTPPVFTEPSVLAPIQSSPAFDGYRSLNVKDFIAMYVGDMNGVLHWFDAMTGRSDWTFDPSLLDPTVESGEDNFTGFQCEGALFSSPNVTSFSVPSAANLAVNYVYTGCSDGRVYALSQYGGAWGGYWAGGHWPLRRGGRDRLRENSTTRTAPDTDVQVDLFKLPYYDVSLAEDPNPMDGANHLSTRDAAGAAWLTNWAVSPAMKMPTKDFVAAPPIRVRNKEIDDYLANEARHRRMDQFIFPDLNTRTTDTPIYFEWGENLNVVIWNLPALDFLSGRTLQSAATSFVFSLANTSPGASAGSLIQQTGRVTLKEYMVLDKNNPCKDAKGVIIPYAYKPLKYGGQTDVKRCYAIAHIYIDPKRNPCYSPGPGWTLVVDVKRKRTNDVDAPLITQRIPIAKLKPADTDGIVWPDFDHEQLLGINNPLAIRDDGETIAPPTSMSTGIAWPNMGINNVFRIDASWRNNPEAHFNGNAALDNSGNYSAGKIPFVNYQFVNHGTSSREASLFVMDRSATGTLITGTSAGTPVTAKLDKFRIGGGDLLFRGGSDQIGASGGTWLPWEFGPGTTDYPNIYRQREEFRKASDDGLPVDQNTTLPPVFGGIPPGKAIGSYEGSAAQPETVFASVEVPRFQSANYNNLLADAISGPMLTDYNAKGYTQTMSAFIDSDEDGSLDEGNQVVGAPSVRQEVYRRYAVGAMVPPDPKVEVEESLVDVGIAPHGLGEQLVGIPGLSAYSAYNPSPEIQQWFKPITIKNSGNVNLPNMQVGKYVRLFGDQSSPASPIPGGEITSSLDWGAGIFQSEPFITQGFGYTLSKARVGEPDPTQMSIPDKRKWDLDFRGAKLATQTILEQVNLLVNGVPGDTTKPLDVKVALKVPLTQPIGTYQSIDESFGLPYVPVFSDRNGDGKLDAGSEPVAQKSFQLKVTVRETQLTGGVTPTGLTQIDPNGSPRFGKGTPAAYRDPNTGKVLLVYSSNGVVSPSDAANLTAADKANAPWMLLHSLLNWDTGWKPTGENPNRWWFGPTWGGPNSSPFVYADGWPDTLLGSYAGWTILHWTPKAVTIDPPLPSVRHYSPVFAVYDTGGNNSVRKAWLAWVGAVDIQDPLTNKVAQEYRVFYTDASGTSVGAQQNGGETYVYAIEHDPAMVKRYPSAAFDTSKGQLWIAWQGGEEGKWGLYCSTSSDPTKTNLWTSDMKLMIPDCLASVSSPNIILRPPWASGDLEAIYAGTTKLGQTSDILFTRYNAISQIDVDNENDPDNKSGLIDRLPSNTALMMPRVLDEKLERDAKYGFYSSRHLAWIRPAAGSALLAEVWGHDIVQGDLPFIRVVLPVDYPLPANCPLPGNVVSGGKTTKQIAISGTDGSVWQRAGDSDDWERLMPSLVTATPAMTMDVDDGSGLYVYKYPQDSVAASILGQMLVDYSAGIVRVTNTLNEVRSGDKFVSADVCADYTPRTWRLTTDKAADSSPRAFIEKTNMSCRLTPDPRNPDPNPGLGAAWRTQNGIPDGSQPVDRLWVFWRKAASGSQSSTIFFATYRAGFDLADLLKRNRIKVVPNATYRITDVTPPAVGPWEIDGSKTKVYITSIGGAPSSAVIHYEYKDSNGNVHPDTVDGAGYGWIPELKEQSLLGFAADGNVNEGSIYAFADPVEVQDVSGTFRPARSSKIWLFWTSTRSGTTDLFWETFSPDFAAR